MVKIFPGLSSRSSVQELEETLRAAGIRLQPRVPNLGESVWTDYAVDDHFARYCYSDINGVEDALKLADDLDADGVQSWHNGPCSKAREIRRLIAESFWADTVSRVRALLSHRRRVCCGCHETGSYSRQKPSSPEQGGEPK